VFQVKVVDTIKTHILRSVWYNLPHYLSRKRKEGSIWKPRNDLCHNSNWIIRICSVSTSHIYSRNRRRHTSILYISNNNQSLLYQQELKSSDDLQHYTEPE